jgi:adenosylhomocysteine nucleosidase
MVGDGLAVRCHGVGPDAAAEAASQLIEGGCVALLSFGLAGGLDERLRPGAVVVAEAIVTEQGELFPSDRRWRARLIQRAILTSTIAEGHLFGSDRPLLDISTKRAFARRFAALGVDMESHAVARVAHRAALPFAALRAVADPAERSVPAWLAGTVDAEGRLRLRAIAAGACAHPADFPRLIRLARDQRAATAALSRVALDAGPFLAFR